MTAGEIPPSQAGLAASLLIVSMIGSVGWRRCEERGSIASAEGRFPSAGDESVGWNVRQVEAERLRFKLIQVIFGGESGPGPCFPSVLR